MVWMLFFAALAALVAASLASATTRRVWLFALFAGKYLLLGLGQLVGIRRLRARLAGRTYEPLTRPAALRLFCEDMGPTFIKFG